MSSLSSPLPLSSSTPITTAETQHSRLQKKVQKVLTSRIRVDSEEMSLALKGMSELIPPGQNTAKTRSKIRSSLDLGIVNSNQELVDSFAKIQKQLQAMEDSVSEMANTCTTISTRLQNARQNTASLLSKTSLLQQQQEALNNKQNLITIFLQKFQLTPLEEKALDMSEITPDFFFALEKINVIKNNCKMFLIQSGFSLHQRAGLDIMESLNIRLEQSYEKLFRWVQKESRELDHSPHQYFGVALRLLQTMPVYYEHCCQDLAQARRLLLIRKFLAALTRGGSGGGGGSARPIEMHAHEPVRYVSDMLSWIHQAVASERDFLMSVLGKDNNTTKEGETRQQQQQQQQQEKEKALLDTNNEKEEEKGDEQVREGKERAIKEKVEKGGVEEESDECGMLLVSIFEGLGRPLKQRVSQTLTSQLGPVVAYTLVSVLEFYFHIVSNLFPSSSSSSSSLPFSSTSASSLPSSNESNSGEVSIHIDSMNKNATTTSSMSGEPETPSSAAVSAAENAASQGTLVTVLSGLLMQAQRAFYTYPQQACEKMKRHPPRVPSDLSPAKEIVSSMSEVIAVLEVYASSINKANTDQEQETQFGPVISAMLEPMLQSLPLSSSQLSLSSQAVYHINVLNYIITALKRHPNAAVVRTRVEILAHSLQLNVECLVGQQTILIMQPSGLSDKINLIRAAKPLDVLSQLPGLSTQEMATCLQAFYTGLVSLSAMVECDRILNAQIRAECRHQVSRAVSIQYSFLYAALSLPTTQYPPNMLTHTPSMIDALLDFSPPPAA